MTERPLVVVTDFVDEPLDIERKILGEVADVVAVNALHESDLQEIAPGAAALMVYHAISLTADTISRLKSCRLIVRCGVGIDNVDGQAARTAGIPFANVPDYGTEEVADSAMAMALSLARGTHLLNSRLRRGQGDWSYLQTVPLTRLRGEVFAILGLGRIGMATALRAKAHGFEVIFYDPYQPEGMDKALGLQRVRSLQELVERARVLSLHAPLTTETAGIVNEALLRQMPPGGYLVNTARGGLVDPAAVLRLLEEGHLAGAGLDVLSHEPPTFQEPLLQAWQDSTHPAHDRLIINPHAAFYCEQGLLDMRVKGSLNCLRVLRGESPLNVVN